MIVGILLLAMLATLAAKWQKPILCALVYTVLKITAVAVMLFLLGQGREEDVVVLIIGLAISFFVSFGLSWLIASLLKKHTGKTWVYIICTLLALPLLIL